MTKFRLGLIVCATLFAVACAGKKGTDELGDLTGAITDMADSLRDMKAAIKTSLDEHDKIVNNTDGDYEGHYKAFSAGVDDIEDRRKDAASDLEAVKGAARPFFDAWEDDLDKFSSAELRKHSEERLDKTRDQYREVKKYAQAARKAYSTMMNTMRDHRLAWERDINQESAAAMKEFRPELEESWATAKKAIDAVILWAEKYKMTVQSRKKPPEADPEAEPEE